ncbi:MAG: recombinase family protein, partial [Blautia sp.]|nr:recombinase family protein [Blautia sp.]
INKEDGSYADPEILNEIRKIYEIAKEEGKLRKATVYLNENGVVTPQVYRGMVVDGDKSQKWYAEKVWNVIKNEGYAGKCKHYERCMELGKHCEREALVSREVFDEVNAKCKYRNR